MSTPPAPQSKYRFPALLYGLLLITAGLALYFFGIVLACLRLILPGWHYDYWLGRMIWYSGMPVIAGLLLSFFDLFILLPKKRRSGDVSVDPPRIRDLTVALTAYNDHLSIAQAVADFRSHPRVRRVIVVDNNSTDGTAAAAAAAGAVVIQETRQGYGNCVHRALREACSFNDTELSLLCEGDCTFRSFDIDKFLAYIPHADIAAGTRIVEQLRGESTQLTTFMYYGNFFVGKLLEAKHIGKGTFTDVGTTYKLCRNEALARLLPLVNPDINLEFNCHFLDAALAHNFRIVECPVTFFSRVGESKGGNVNNRRAMRVGLRMIAGILFGWQKPAGPLAHARGSEMRSRMQALTRSRP